MQGGRDMKGVSDKEYVKEIDMPINKQEKYLYQILISVSELIEIIKKNKEAVIAPEFNEVKIVEKSKEVKRGRKRKEV